MGPASGVASALAVVGIAAGMKLICDITWWKRVSLLQLSVKQQTLKLLSNTCQIYSYKKGNRKSLENLREIGWIFCILIVTQV